MISVKVQWPAGDTEVFSFDESQVTIGRSSENHIPIATSTGVSRSHARLFIEGKMLYLEDLGSTNGTLVNSENILIEQVSKDDVIQIGEVMLQAILTKGNSKVIANSLSKSNDIYTEPESSEKDKALVEEKLSETLVEKKEKPSRTESKVSQLGISKLKQLSKQHKSKTPVFEGSSLVAFIESLLPEVWEQINRADIESVVLQKSKLFINTIEGAQETRQIRLEEGVIKSFLAKITDDTPAKDIYTVDLNNGLKIRCVSDSLSVFGNLIVFEKDFVEDLSMDDLVELGVVDLAASEWLRFAIERGRKILISCPQQEDAHMFAQALARLVPEESNICAFGAEKTFSVQKESFQSINLNNRRHKEVEDVVRIMRKVNLDYFIVEDIFSSYGGALLREIATNTAGSIACIRAKSVEQAISRTHLLISNTFAGSNAIAEIRKELFASVNVVIQLSSSKGVAPQLEEIQQLNSVDTDGSIVMQEIFALKDSPSEEDTSHSLDA